MTQASLCNHPYLKALYSPKTTVALEFIRLSEGEVPVGVAAASQTGPCVYAVFDMGGGGARMWRLFTLTRQLARRQFFCRLVGLVGPTAAPSVVVPLRREILGYVHTVAFRGTDSPLRVFLKRLSGFLPVSLTWRGPLILVASPRPEVFDRFVLLTDDREIAFLFHVGESAPWAVCKRGDAEALAVERRNHERAVRLLGGRVPALVGGEESDTLTLEALPERFLTNIVAGAWFGRRRVFEREAIALIDFCLAVYRQFVRGAPPESAAVTAAEVGDLIDGMGELLIEAPESAFLSAAMHEMVGGAVPRLLQHGDFCVRNVLVVGGNRGHVLIDWEDSQERRWPLIDFALLRLSLKEAFTGLFHLPPEEMERLPDLARRLFEGERELADLLGLDGQGLRQAATLSLACLCCQNLNKGRDGTARRIFQEMVLVAGSPAL